MRVDKSRLVVAGIIPKIVENSPNAILLIVSNPGEQMFLSSFSIQLPLYEHGAEFTVNATTTPQSENRQSRIKIKRNNMERPIPTMNLLTVLVLLFPRTFVKTRHNLQHKTRILRLFSVVLHPESWSVRVLLFCTPLSSSGHSDVRCVEDQRFPPSPRAGKWH